MFEEIKLVANYMNQIILNSKVTVKKLDIFSSGATNDTFFNTVITKTKIKLWIFN